MNQLRTFLLFAWLLVGFLIYQAWQVDYATPERAPQAGMTDSGVPDATLPDPSRAIPAEPGMVPEPPAPGQPVPADPALETGADLAPIVVESDRLRLTFDPRGASLIRAQLLDYSETTEPDAPPVELLSPQSGSFFVAQSGWVAADNAAPTHQAVFTLQGELPGPDDGADRVELPFVWSDPANGRELRRTWVVERGSYLLTMHDEWRNGAGEPLHAQPYQQLLREPPPALAGGFTNPAGYSFVGAAWYSPAEKFNKIQFDDFDPREPLDVAANGGWIAMLEHYFFAAWIPADNQVNRFSSAVVSGNRYLIRSLGEPVVIEAGGTASRSAELYVGPKLQGELGKITPGLELTIDYGILTLLAEPLFWLLSFFHSIVGNWGWAIVLLVVLIKAVFFKLSETQYKSFAKMRRVQPRIESLKERYGDDRAKFNAAMMELYKKEKINPMGGCLPILVQIPVFIALYWVLLESVELRHAPWILWIQNLSAPDPYFILPVLNLVTMWLTQKLSPAPGMDPVQRKMMQAMPIVFGVLFAFFPAGLVLYWTVNGALGLLQQWVITRRHGQPAKA